MTKTSGPTESVPQAAAQEESPALVDHGIRRVLLVDDAIDSFGKELWDDDVRWVALIDTLARTFGDQIDTPRSEQLRSLEDAASRVRELDQLRADIGADEVNAVVGDHDDGRDVTEKWVESLKKLGTEVVLARDMSHIRELAKDGDSEPSPFIATFDLILLDYEFVRGDSGKHSSEIAKLIKAETAALDHPPLLFKFSRREPELREEERTEFAVEVGYPRGCYYFLAKSDVIHPTFEAVLVGAIKAGRVGQGLYQVAKSAAHEIATDFERHLIDMLVGRLDPTSAQLMFAQRLRPEGMSELDYVVEMLGSFFASQARESDVVVSAVQSFLEAIAAVPSGANPADTAGIARLEMELRFDRSVNRFRRQLGFGDLFRWVGTDTVGMVVTRQSHLMVRGGDEAAKKAPHVSWVSLSLGRLVDESTGNGTRFSETGGPPFQRLEWLNTTVSMPRAVLDMCAMRDDGRASVPTKAVASGWWTATFSEYANAQVKAIRESRVAKRGAPTRIDLFADSSSDGRAVLGTGANLTVATDGTLPLQRVARMRFIDALAHTQALLADQGKVGSVPDMEASRTPTSVDFFVGKTVAATVDGLALRMSRKKDVLNIDVETSVLRSKLESHAAYEPLIIHAAGYPEGYNLLKARDDLGYGVEPNGGRFAVRPPAANGEPSSGIEAAHVQESTSTSTVASGDEDRVAVQPRPSLKKPSP